MEQLRNKFAKIKDWIQKFQGTPEQGFLISQLSQDQGLEQPERALIFAHFYPPNLQDGELIPRINAARVSRNDITGKGFLGYSDEEQVELYSAFKSPQYHRYMMHLLGAYREPKYLHNQSGEGILLCDVCGKSIYEHEKWWKEIVPQVPTESEKREYLAFFSEKSSTSLCLNCIAQLKYLEEFLNTLDPSILAPFWAKNRIQ